MANKKIKISEEGTYATPAEINQYIIANLGGSMEAHLRDKHLFHKQGLPFYTCVEGNNWTKEFPNGKIHLVHKDVDLKTLERKETFVRKIK